jgi:transposase
MPVAHVGSSAPRFPDPLQQSGSGSRKPIKNRAHDPIRNRDRAHDHQRFRLRDLLRYNLQTVRAYLLKEDFQQFWEYESPTWAGKFLDDWCRQVMRSRIDPMKKVAKTLRRHRELILNYFRAKKAFSSGIVEGLNNKAKLTMRKSYGFRTFHVTEIALYHALGKLPLPDTAHRFF